MPAVAAPAWLRPVSYTHLDVYKRQGESYTFYGTVEGTLLRRTMTNPAFEREGLHAVTGCIVPVYPLTAGVGQSLLHRTIRQGLDDCLLYTSIWWNAP